MPTPAEKAQIEALFEAIGERDAPSVVDLLASGATPDAIGPNQLSALFAATVNDDYATALALLEAGGNPDLGGVDCKTIEDFATPLNYACYKGLRSIVKLLLDRGANPNITSANNRNAAHHFAWGLDEAEHLAWTSGGGTDRTRLQTSFVEKTFARLLDAGLLETTAGEDHVPLLHAALLARAPLLTFEKLIDRGADPCQKRPSERQLVHYATLYERTDVLSMLARLGISMDALDQNGRTPLFMASESVLPDLLEMGADIDHQDVLGETVLHDQISAAAEQGAHQVSPRIQILVEAGARLDLRDNRGETAVDLAKRLDLESHAALLSAAAARQAMLRASTTHAS